MAIEATKPLLGLFQKQIPAIRTAALNAIESGLEAENVVVLIIDLTGKWKFLASGFMVESEPAGETDKQPARRKHPISVDTRTADFAVDMADTLELIKGIGQIAPPNSQKLITLLEAPVPSASIRTIVFGREDINIFTLPLNSPTL